MMLDGQAKPFKKIGNGVYGPTSKISKFHVFFVLVAVGLRPDPPIKSFTLKIDLCECLGAWWNIAIWGFCCQSSTNVSGTFPLPFWWRIPCLFVTIWFIDVFFLCLEIIEVCGLMKLLVRFYVFMLLLAWPFHTFPSNFYTHMFHVKWAIWLPQALC